MTDSFSTPMRSLQERMTNPSAQDREAQRRVGEMDNAELRRIIDHMAMMMEYVSNQHKSVRFKRIDHGNEHGFKVIMDTSRTNNPLLIGPNNPLIPSVADDD
jgi:hypothetical protein